jgi:protein-S-isoprenylcysteine O-methyltransferase Ste14
MSLSAVDTPTKAAWLPVLEDVAGRALFMAWLLYSVTSQLSLIPHILANSTGIMLPLELARTLLLIGFSGLCLAFTFARRAPMKVASGWEPRVTAILGSYLILVIPLLPAADLGPFWTLLAVIIMALGLASSIYSLAWLGRSFSIMAVARKLVTDGPYRIVRHPLYACEMLMMLGVVIANFSFAAVAVALVVVALLYRRMVNEERVLSETFAEYEDYARRVPRIIPWPIAQRAAH